MKYISILAVAALAVTTAMADEVKPKRELTAEEAAADAELAKKYPKPPERKAPNLLNLPPVEPGQKRIDIEEHLAWPKEVGDAVVALWSGNATGALALSSDDNHWAGDKRWEEYAERYPSIPVTHVVNTIEPDPLSESIKIRWKELTELGHQVHSHGNAHWGKHQFETATEAEKRREYAAPVRIIEEATGKKVKAIGYAMGYGEPEFSKDYYIAGRGGFGAPNDAATTHYMYTASKSGLADPGFWIQSVLNHDAKVWGKNYYGGWLSVHLHGLGKGDEWKEAFEEHIIPYVKDGTLWATSFANAAMYGQSRDTSKLKVTKNEPKAIAFVLTDDMDDEYFDHPLTVKVRVPNDWKAVTAKQGGKEVKAKLVENEGKKFAFVEAVPDRGETVITP